jgi:hypothetical protein
MYFEDTIDEAKYCGHLFGLGSSLFQNGIPYDAYIPSSAVLAAQQVAAHVHATAHASISQTSLANITNTTAANLLGQNGNNNNNSASAPNLTNLLANGSLDSNYFCSIFRNFVS